MRAARNCDEEQVNQQRWTKMYLSHGLARLSIAKDIETVILIKSRSKCFNKYHIVEISSAFMFCPSMKDSKDSTVEITVLHIVDSQ